MARGPRKTLEDKIEEKREVIANLEARLNHEYEELQALLDEQDRRELEKLKEVLDDSGLSIEELISVAKEIKQESVA